MNFFSTASCRRYSRRACGGFSLTEIIVTVAVVGILSGIAIPAYQGVMEQSRVQASRDKLQMLNRAVRAFAQTNWNLSLPRDDGSSADEIAILRTLQWRDPVEPAPGAPYISEFWDPVPSVSEDDYRLRWQGSFWEYLGPGESGTGLKVDLSSGDIGSQVNFGAGFSPVGG
ncbi:MAG: type IV pilin protein [Verrucomicrobiales bacterium]